MAPAQRKPPGSCEPVCIPLSTFPPAHHPPTPQFTLYHFWGYSYGRAAFLLGRLAGAADLLLVPITQLALKVGERSNGWKERWAGSSG